MRTEDEGSPFVSPRRHENKDPFGPLSQGLRKFAALTHCEIHPRLLTRQVSKASKPSQTHFEGEGASLRGGENKNGTNNLPGYSINR